MTTLLQDLRYGLRPRAQAWSALPSMRLPSRFETKHSVAI